MSTELPSQEDNFPHSAFKCFDGGMVTQDFLVIRAVTKKGKGVTPELFYSNYNDNGTEI